MVEPCWNLLYFEYWMSSLSFFYSDVCSSFGQNNIYTVTIVLLLNENEINTFCQVKEMQNQNETKSC